METEKIVTLLNEALKMDRKAITNLFFTRVPCNKKLASHPTIQVKGYPGSTMEVGIMGILNGLFSDDEYLIMELSKDGSSIMKFGTMEK